MKRVLILSLALLALTFTNAQDSTHSNKGDRISKKGKCFDASKTMLLSKRYKFTIQDFVNGHSIPRDIMINGNTALVNLGDWPQQFSATGYGGKNTRLSFTGDVSDYKLTINETKKKFQLQFVTKVNGDRVKYDFDIDACSVAYVSIQSDKRIDINRAGGLIRPLE